MPNANAANGPTDFHHARPHSCATDTWSKARTWFSQMIEYRRKNRAVLRSAPIDVRLLSDIGHTPWGNSVASLAEQNERHGW